ncbi:MAG TPA: hypothetical protein VJ914_19450 [Pseudonocardiaceae bacterium]|nr:hypothetical protein [Pseudonocardiaceae bacterium]
MSGYDRSGQPEATDRGHRRRDRCRLGVRILELLADVVPGACDQTASIASGSFHTEGMIVAPCGPKTRDVAAAPPCPGIPPLRHSRKDSA